MSWQDIVIQQAVTTVIFICGDAKTRSRFKRQLFKVFQTIAIAFKNDAEFQRVTKGE